MSRFILSQPRTRLTGHLSSILATQLGLKLLQQLGQAGAATADLEGSTTAVTAGAAAAVSVAKVAIKIAAVH